MNSFHYAPPQDPLTIIHQDDDLLLVDKPAGLLSVLGKAAEHADCLETRVKTAYPTALLVHRLDMDTMNKPAQRHLGLQFERRHIDKTYIAEVFGKVKEDEGEVKLPLIVDWPNRPLQKVCFDTGKAAQTVWQVVGRADLRTRVRLTPRTGRSHQLRVHMRELEHPILGDRFYSSGDALKAADRLMLHSESLSFYHPTGGARVKFQSPCPF
ncbi:MAG: tRNA pseudouridine32 synthase/23S rRNA pseudouridine746 synthase [Paracoccaceae bacterium]|jgi:tRNA pseudouridine32 synthase/23S rRNA pseudouridine746 synthase